MTCPHVATGFPASKHHAAKRNGFSLIELVVVILILGVIAAIAAPRMFDTAGDARSASTRQSLAVLRNALEIFNVQQGRYPVTTSSVDFIAELEPLLNGPFPAPAAPVDRGTAVIFVTAGGVESGGNPSGSTAAAPGWRFNTSTQRFSVNSTGEEGNW